MKKNKFVEGEVVILQSKSYPNYNGEHCVKHVVFYGDVVYDRLAQKDKLRIPKGGARGVLSGYILEAIIPSATKPEVESLWAEVALRKKHLPGDMSYDTLMSSLKLGQPVRV